MWMRAFLRLKTRVVLQHLVNHLSHRRSRMKREDSHSELLLWVFWVSSFGSGADMRVLA